MAIVNPTDYTWSSFNSNGVQRGINKTDSDKILYRFIGSSSGTFMYTYDSNTIDELIADGGGSGLPAGGTIGQTLEKNSSTDGDASWVDIPKKIQDELDNLDMGEII